MKIVILDGAVVNPGDISWEPIEKHGVVTLYDRTSDDELLERSQDADILLSNKRVIDKKSMESLPSLKLICLLATGHNNIDTAAAKDLNITVCNAVGYGSTSVAQHVFALILESANMVGVHNKSVHHGEWSSSIDWCYWNEPLVELAGKTLGIYGLGKIGNKVADIALAFDMKVLANHKHPDRDAREGVEFVDIETLCRDSDFITLHAPLSESNKGIINKKLLAQMKPSTFLVNTGRGGLLNETDLKYALENDIIKGAGLDVLSSEPPLSNHPLLGVKNCIITPHQAWAAKNSRQRLINIVGQNIDAFIKGSPKNVVN